MAYSGFRYETLKRTLGIDVRSSSPLFTAAAPRVPVPVLLTETLKDGVPLALRSRSEKARSEWIIAPVLLAAWKQTAATTTLLSGATMDVDPSRGLDGVVDFVVVGDPLAQDARAPIVTVIEAKRQDLEQGLAQCAAAMLAAYLLNTAAMRTLTVPIYGVVTTGAVWSFYQMATPDTVVSGALEIGIGDLDDIFAILVAMMSGRLHHP